MKYILFIALCSTLTFCAEEKRPLTPAAPKTHHRHLAITIDKDSPIIQNIAINQDLPPNRLKLKLALVSAASGIVGAGIAATVAILTKRC